MGGGRIGVKLSAVFEGLSPYLWLLARVFALAQNVERHLMLVRLLLDVICVRDDFLRLDFQPSLFECLALYTLENILAEVEIASRQLIKS